jgi:hypothetical protein
VLCLPCRAQQSYPLPVLPPRPRPPRPVQARRTVKSNQWCHLPRLAPPPLLLLLAVQARGAADCVASLGLGLLLFPLASVRLGVWVGADGRGDGRVQSCSDCCLRFRFRASHAEFLVPAAVPVFDAVLLEFRFGKPRHLICWISVEFLRWTRGVDCFVWKKVAKFSQSQLALPYEDLGSWCILSIR